MKFLLEVDPLLFGIGVGMIGYGLFTIAVSVLYLMDVI